jgi:hypothetical protein
MQVTLSNLEKQNEAYTQIADESTQVAILANETLRTATTEFNEAIERMKKVHKKQLSDSQRTIKILIVALVIVAGCSAYLGTRILTNRC